MNASVIRRIGWMRPRYSPIFRHEHRQLPLFWHAPRNLTLTFTFTPLKRSISSHQPPSHPLSTSTTSTPKPPKPRTWVLLTLAAGGLFTIFLTTQGRSRTDTALNKSTFIPFAITSREQVSPSAFILTVRPSCPCASTAHIISQAQRHGLWSVEIKQPQLQIARHYTPLPPSHPAAAGKREGKSDDADGSELRFLIRRTDGGEMSTYLHKRRVGDEIWLRGPHLGFDVSRRLGRGCEVVFLAGGTGVAPALQIAARLLDAPDPDPEPNSNPEDDRPSITILWANRRSADALGRAGKQQQQQRRRWWLNLWSRADAPHESPPPSSSLARQIRALQRRHPGRFRVSYYVDEEGSFVGARDLSPARDPKTTPSPTPNPVPNPSCTWHSPHAIASLPSDDDSTRNGVPCTCPAQSGAARSRKLVCVSGPDGFISAYAGPKRWRDGNEMQGAVRGVVGQVMEERGEENWVVLKL
ncbi:hypothetical protein F4810DRAFT_550236 [Camillea tinctor]|nr:hypothetical protein F4810DRAFT_550236 [Camillea tinctor]